MSVHCSWSCSILCLCSREGGCMKWKTPCCLPSVPVLSSPPTRVLGQALGLGSALRTSSSLTQLLTHSAGLWGFALRGFVWSYQNIFGMLWRSGCQRLCCLQNEEMLMAGKKARSVSILKRGRLLLFLCCMLAACKCGLQQSMGSYWEPVWLVLRI